MKEEEPLGLAKWNRGCWKKCLCDMKVLFRVLSATWERIY